MEHKRLKMYKLKCKKTIFFIIFLYLISICLYFSACASDKDADYVQNSFTYNSSFASDNKLQTIEYSFKITVHRTAKFETSYRLYASNGWEHYFKKNFSAKTTGEYIIEDTIQFETTENIEFMIKDVKVEKYLRGTLIDACFWGGGIALCLIVMIIAALQTRKKNKIN